MKSNNELRKIALRLHKFVNVVHDPPPLGQQNSLSVKQLVKKLKLIMAYYIVGIGSIGPTSCLNGSDDG